MLKKYNNVSNVLMWHVNNFESNPMSIEYQKSFFKHID